MGKDAKKKTDRPLPEVPQTAAQAPPEGFDMVFHCQLAHGSPTRQVRDFTNVKQLYESIAKAHGIKSEEVRGLAARSFSLTLRRFCTAPSTHTRST